jgi:glycosyltransferase involved in cell wall biosynthesis
MSATKKIKVVHLVSDLGIGGVQKVVLDICSSADLEKYDLFIFLLKHNTELLPTYFLSPSVKIKNFDYTYSADYSLISYFKHCFFKNTVAEKGKEIIDEAVALIPDILHVHIHPRELNLGIIIQEKTHCKLIYTEHLVRLTPSSFSLNLLGKILRSTYHKYHLIAVSQSVFAELQEHKLVGKDKSLTLIENKLNLKLFPLKQNKSAGPVTVVYVARIGHPKGHAELIRAWSKLPPGIDKKLVLVGPDELNNEIQNLAKELVPDNSVVFMGKQLDVVHILSECDFAVLPSFKEGLPISLLEKMAMQLPAVVSDIPELTDIVKDGVNGLVFKCGDIDDLAKKILLLIQNPELRLQMGKAARTTVERRFGSSNIALASEKVYEKAMNCS